MRKKDYSVIGKGIRHKRSICPEGYDPGRSCKASGKLKKERLRATGEIERRKGTFRNSTEKANVHEKKQ